MDREVFFEWLNAMLLPDDSRELSWIVTQDDGDGCITVKFHNVEEEEMDDD